jgi:hypothetical protein
MYYKLLKQKSYATNLGSRILYDSTTHYYYEYMLQYSHYRNMFSRLANYMPLYQEARLSLMTTLLWENDSHSPSWLF